MRYIIEYLEDLSISLDEYESRRLYSLRQLEYVHPKDYTSSGKPFNFRENCLIRVRCIETNEVKEYRHLKYVASLCSTGRVFGFEMSQMKDGRIQYIAYALDVIDFQILSCIMYKGKYQERDLYDLGIDSSSLRSFNNLARYSALLVHNDGIVIDFSTTIYSSLNDTFDTHTVTSFIRRCIKIDAVQNFPIFCFEGQITISNNIYVYQYVNKDLLLKILIKLELMGENSRR